MSARDDYPELAHLVESVTRHRDEARLCCAWCGEPFPTEDALPWFFTHAAECPGTREDDDD